MHDLKTKSTQSIDDLKEEIVTLEERLLNKSHEVKSLQSKLSYATTDHNNAYELERNIRRSAQNDCKVLDRKFRKSREVIRKYKDENESLKSELAYQRSLSKKYQQRSIRLRKKLTDLAEVAGTSSRDRHEDADRMRRELREMRVARGNSAFYDLWRGECDKSRALRRELTQAENELENCDGELVNATENLTALTAATRAQTQRMQKRIYNRKEWEYINKKSYRWVFIGVSRISNKSSLNTFVLLMVLNSMLKKVRRLQAEQKEAEQKLITGN